MAPSRLSTSTTPAHDADHHHAMPSLSARVHSTPNLTFDRALFQKLEEINSDIARLTRLSSDMPMTRELEQVQDELRRAQHDASLVIQSQKDLLDKIERQERSAIRRFLTFGREQKVESLKAKLRECMSESAQADARVQRLERRSDTLLESSRHGTLLEWSGNNQPFVDNDDASHVAWQLEQLEREKQDIVDNLLATTAVAVVPDAQQLRTRVAMYMSEIRASESIEKQVHKCWNMYRQALQLLQSALSTTLSPEYSGTLKEFVTGPYLLTVEAGQLMEAAKHVLQPEARRRFREFAPELMDVHAPAFPQAVVDFAKRARVNYDKKTTLQAEGTRKLHAAEEVVAMTHRIVIDKLETINKWKTEVEADLSRSKDALGRVEKRLQQQMAVMARSASA